MNMTHEQIEATQVQPPRREALPPGELAALHEALSRAQMITADAALLLRRRGLVDTATHAALYRMTGELEAMNESLQPTAFV